MKGLIAVLLGASPIVLHLALVRSSRPLMVVFLAMVATGLLVSFARSRRPPWGIALGGLAACGLGVLALLDVGMTARVASAWPILVLLATAWVFGSSLRPGRMPLIECIARFIDHGDAMPRELIAYTRVLTWAWTIVPLALALVSMVLAQFASREMWSLFTNVLSYPMLAVLFLAEYPYRRWRYPRTPHTNPVTVALRLVRHAPEVFRPQGHTTG
ncbi:MAG: hypothetical protein WCE38_03495 [Burkholderiales bacterium]